MSIVSGGFSCNISLNPGVNLVVVRATDLAGNVSAGLLHLSLNAPLPAPTSLQITPSGVNMVVGETQQFTAVDQLGRPRADATWSVSDTSLASLSTDTPSLLTAVAPGQLTLTATVGGQSAQTQVTILSGVSLTPGTVRWSAPPVPGFTTQQVVQARSPIVFAPSTSISTRITTRHLILRIIYGSQDNHAKGRRQPCLNA